MNPCRIFLLSAVINLSVEPVDTEELSNKQVSVGALI